MTIWTPLFFLSLCLLLAALWESRRWVDTRRRERKAIDLAQWCARTAALSGESSTSVLFNTAAVGKDPALVARAHALLKEMLQRGEIVV